LKVATFPITSRPTELAMKTMKKKATVGSILAIDLGKYKSVACVYPNAEEAEIRYVTFDTTPDELANLLKRVKPSVLIIEACALSGWVHDQAVENGIACRVANTASEAWKFKHTKRKTDKDDALRLAELFALGQLPTVTIPPKADRQWKSAIAGRQALVGRRIAVQNRIRALLVGQGLPMPRGAKAWSELGLQGIEQLVRPLAECTLDELWRGLLGQAVTEFRQVRELIAEVEKKLDAIGQTKPAVKILESAPGIGPRTAEAVAAHLGDATRFKTAGQVSAYAGLVPKQFQSGETDRRGRITRRGPAILRKLLVECAWCSLRYNTWARRVYLRISHGGKVRKKQAIVALARKILVRCWAMLRDNAYWRDDPEPAPASVAA
jgi:transposase